MPVNDRKQVLNRLAAATEPYLVTNARCLTEGIDVPALDAVAFADPRKSQVDIVQAVGRAMRKPMGKTKKTTGYIILPVYLTKKELKDPETAVEGSAFEPVLQVLRALKDHDPFMARFMAKILVAKGKKPHQKASGIGEVLEVSIGDDLSKELAKRLLDAVQLRAIEVSAGVFEHRFALLEGFKSREGHCLVPQDWIEDGIRLGQWVSYIRDKDTHLSEEQRQRLISIGFTWDAWGALFALNLEALNAFIDREGHTHVPPKWVESGIRLGQWCNSIRTRREKGLLSAGNIAALDKIGMSWDVLSDRFETKFKALAAYVRREGHAKVPLQHKEAGFAMGAWVNSLRARREKLSAGQIRRLDALGMQWDTRARAFDQGMAALQAFVKREGHAQVPVDWVEGTYRLGKWAASKRVNKNSLSKERLDQLNSVGFVWNSYDSAYERNLKMLKVFVKRERHARVPTGWVEQGVRLGQWVADIRSERRRSKLTPEQLAELLSLGFVWDPLASQWAAYLAAFKAFVKREGHGLVARDKVEDGENLGMWVHNLRRTADDLSPARRAELSRAGFIWDPRDWVFERNLKMLTAFKRRNGHVRVPAVWKEDGYGLGAWLSNIRRGVVKVSPEQKRRLRALGVK
jgi:hypothetical protein